MITLLLAIIDSQSVDNFQFLYFGTIIIDVALLDTIQSIKFWSKK